jgi:hypothetical protein
LHAEWQPRKEDTTLISGASFAYVKGCQTVKGLDCVVDVNGMWFDVEATDDVACDLQPDDWRVHFPEYKLMAFNSFNNGKDGKLKYRVVFPTSLAVTKEVYHEVWDRMTDRIRAAGYFVGTEGDYIAHKERGGHLKFSGIDISKRCANSMFYLPSRAGLGTKYTFWHENWGDDAEILDPREFYDARPAPRFEYVETPAHPNPPPQDAAAARMAALRAALAAQAKHSTYDPVAAALADWHGSKPGHVEFLTLGKRLARALPYDDVKAIMQREGQRDVTRKREINGALKWLRSRCKAASI